MNLYDLYLSAVSKAGKNNVIKDLNIAPGTAKRWEDKKEVPPQYYFDLMRLCDLPIDYSSFTPREKDQFFTNADIAENCMSILYNILEQNGCSIDDYIFLEPSAGDGAFLPYLPENYLAFDVEPKNDKVLTQDFFTWQPEKDKKYIVIGNPPFGLRGQQALKFINKALTFADFCAFILPPLFDSDGRGTPKKRIDGNLIYTGPCGSNYHYPDGKAVEVNTIFQIWTRLNLTSLVEEEEAPIGFSVYSISDGGTPGTTRNKDKIGKCDFYLPSTIFGIDKMRTYETFDKLPLRRGYGIILEDKNLISAIKLPWGEIAFESTNGALNLRKSIIIKTINRLNLKDA